LLSWTPAATWGETASWTCLSTAHKKCEWQLRVLGQRCMLLHSVPSVPQLLRAAHGTAPAVSTHHLAACSGHS
jgi:hypothetical protein